MTVKSIPIENIQVLGTLTSKSIRVMQLFKRNEMIFHLLKSADF